MNINEHMRKSNKIRQQKNVSHGKKKQNPPKENTKSHTRWISLSMGNGCVTAQLVHELQQQYKQVHIQSPWAWVLVCVGGAYGLVVGWGRGYFVPLLCSYTGCPSGGLGL